MVGCAVRVWRLLRRSSGGLLGGRRAERGPGYSFSIHSSAFDVSIVLGVCF